MRSSGTLWRLGFLIAPKPPSRFDIDRRTICRFACIFSRIDCAVFDPCLHVGDDCARKLGLLRRHLQIGIATLDRRQQKALRGITGHNGGPRVAAGANALLRIQQQAALGFTCLDRMTLVAMLCQDRPDFCFEEREVRGVLGAKDRQRQGCCDYEGCGSEAYSRGRARWLSEPKRTMA
jgi:hypothetical protein